MKKQLSPWWPRLAVLLLLVYWAALAMGTHIPNYGHGPARYNDKAAHFLGYAGLAFLLCFSLATRQSFSIRAALAVLAIVMGYGILDELLQVPIPGRTGDPADWLADSLGGAFGIAVFALANIVRKKIARKKKAWKKNAAQ